MPMRWVAAHRLKGTDGFGTIARRTVGYSKNHREPVMSPADMLIPRVYLADLRAGKISAEELSILLVIISRENPETMISNLGARSIATECNLKYTTVRGCIRRLEVKKYIKNLSPRGSSYHFCRNSVRGLVQIGARFGMVLDVDNITTYMELKYISCEVLLENVRGFSTTSCEVHNKPKYRNGSLLSGREQQQQRSSTSFLYDSEYLKVSEKQHELLTKEFQFDPAPYYPEIHRWLEERDEHAKSPIAVVRAWLTRLGGNGNGNGTHPSNGNGSAIKSRAEILTERRQQATEAAIQRTYGRTGPDR